MTQFHDFFISRKLQDEAEEFGWSGESVEASVRFLEAQDWGELKKEVGKNRENYDILAFSGSHELNRKALSDPRVDVVFPPQDRKDSGMNHVDAKKGAKNKVAIGFSIKRLPENVKRQSQELSKWRRNLKLCEKYGTPVILTTEAEREHEMRKPRDLAAVINSLGFNGKKAVSEHPGRILRKNLEAQKDATFGAGHEAVE